MPTYKYECKECKEQVREFQQISDKPLEDCPKCGKKSLERLICWKGTVIFNGEGFYSNDYKKPGFKTENGEKDGKEKNTENTQ